MTPRVELVDMVTELIRPHQHREHYQVQRGQTWFGQDHLTNVPSLLAQLALTGQSRRSDESGSGAYGSRPAGPLEAVDCLTRIDQQAWSWIRQLGGDDVTAKESRALVHRVKARVLRVNGLLVSAECCGRRPKAGCCPRHDVEHEIRRWWTQARIVTGWDSPAWRPDNTCPLCAVRGGLRVKLADRSGFCVECGETWTPETIALLADHIRGENAEDVAAS